MTSSSAAPIASTAVDLTYPDGRRVSGCIWIGMPYTVDELQANCSCGIDGLDEQLRPISGNDTLQALLPATRLLAMRLTDFVEKGGRVVYSGTDDEVDLEAYFGTLLRPW